MASVVCCRPTACCRGHAGRCYGAAGVRTLPRLLAGQAWACGLACCADWQGWNLLAAPDSMAQRADGQRPSAQLLEPLGPVRDAPLTALRMRACPCCVLPSSLPRARGADTMPAVAMSLACTRIFFSKTGCARAQAGGCRCSMRSWNPEVRWRNGGATWLRRMLASYIGDAASCGMGARTTALRYGHRRCELRAPSSTTSYVFRRAFYPHARAVLCQHFHVAHRHRVCRVRAVLTRCLSLRVSLACMWL